MVVGAQGMPMLNGYAIDLIGMAHDDFPVIASSATTDVEGSCNPA